MESSLRGYAVKYLNNLIQQIYVQPNYNKYKTWLCVVPIKTKQMLIIHQICINQIIVQCTYNIIK